MPLKPEFGYFLPFPEPSPQVRPALAFTVFGLVACMSGAVPLVADHPEPRSAFALAPIQSPSRETATPAATAEMPAADTVLAQKVTKADGIKSCRRNASDDADANCDSGVARDPGVVHHPVTDLPATAEIPIGHISNGPAVDAPESAVLVASTPPPKEGAPESTDAAPPSLKPRKTARHQSSHRYSYADSSFWLFDRHYRRGDFARQRPSTHFW